MKKIVRLLLLSLAFTGLVGIPDGRAAFIGIEWRDELAPIGVTNPDLYRLNVFTMGTRVGPNLPPARGGGIAIIDVVDRNQSQLIQLTAPLHISPPEGHRYVLRFDDRTRWIREQLYYKGFITIKWSQIRSCFWDKKNQRTLADFAWRYASAGAKEYDNCTSNCDYQACVEAGKDWIDIEDWCDCEEWQGRWFCHKKNFFKYSRTPDRGD